MDATLPEETESRLQRLTELRAKLERQLAGDIDPRAFASLSREYRAALLEIETLSPDEKKGDAVDEIAARRSARGAGSPASSARSV